MDWVRISEEFPAEAERLASRLDPASPPSRAARRVGVIMAVVFHPWATIDHSLVPARLRDRFS
jgi:hypothetical protein